MIELIKSLQLQCKKNLKSSAKKIEKSASCQNKNHKDDCDFGDMMPEEDASGTDGKTGGVDEDRLFAPDKLILTRHVLIRQHNKPRKHLFTPNEVDDDPSPIPLKFLDIMRRTDTSVNSLGEFHLEDFWTDRAIAKRELSEYWVGRIAFSLNAAIQGWLRVAKRSRNSETRKFEPAGKYLGGRMERYE